MNLFTRKAHTVIMCNLIVPFVCTGFLGVRNYTGIITGNTTDEAHEISLTASDTEPVSQYGEGENKFAFITESVEAVISQQEGPISQDMQGEENEFAFVTKSVKAVINQQEVAQADKKVESKTTSKTTKKSTKTTKKSTKTTSVVEKKEVAKSASYSKPSSSSLTGEAIVSFAKQFLGLKYRSGTPSLTKGADCSGFTMLIYKEFGVSLPRNVLGQMGRGVAVSKSNLQKGDLVFYKACKNCKVSHVGIYAGGGQVIHESRPGVGVKYSTVNMMYYAGARRVINSKATQIATQKLEEQKKNETKTDTSSNNTVNTEVTNNTTATNNEEKNENVNNNVVVNTTPTTTVPKEEIKQEVVNTDTPKEEVKVETKEEPKKETVVEEQTPTTESN